MRQRTLIVPATLPIRVFAGIVIRLAEAVSRGTKVGDMLTLAPERYTVGLCMVTKVIP